MSAQSKAELMRKTRKAKKDKGLVSCSVYLYPWQKRAVEMIRALGNDAVIYIDDGAGTMAQFKNDDPAPKQ